MVFKKEYIPWNKGLTKETDERLMKCTGMGGKLFSVGHRLKLSKSRNGKPSPMKGKHHTDKTKKKISENKERNKKISKALKGRKLSEEHKEKLSLSHIGKKYPPFTEEHKKKIGLSNSISQKCKKLSLETRKKISLSLQGEKSYSWKGGITPLTKSIRRSFEYRQWRSDVFTRDNFTCQYCVKRGCYLEAHHKKGFTRILEDNNVKTYKQSLECSELWNINNGQTLCKDCHNKTKKGRNKNGG